MKILYDGQIYNEQVAGGINRYFSNIISRLPKDYIPSLTTQKVRNVNYPFHPNLKTIRWYKKFRPERLRIVVDKLYFESQNRCNGGFDIVHPTYYSLVTRQEIKSYKFPVVLTIYDMIHELFSEEIANSNYTIALKRQAISAAQAIICISENTKKDLLKLYSVPENIISVTYLATEIDESFANGLETIPKQAYYLYIGSRIKYKNFDGLLSSFAKFISIKPDIKLCVVGSPFNKAEEKLINQLKLDNYLEHYGYVSDTHLAKLYKNSIALVYPSLYEGFGIPPLEAMSCGTAVIASSCSSIPEVVGDAGILFNPQQTENLIDILVYLVDNPAERDRLIARGYDRAKEFSWDKTVAQTIDVYRSISR